MNNQARTPAPSSARTSTSVRASTPTRTPTPLRTPTPVRTRTPIRTLTPVLTPSPAGTPPLVLTPAPAQIPTLVPTPALARIPRLVPPPAPAWIPTPVPTPVPVRNPTPVPTPARTLTPPVRVPAPAPAQLLAGIRAALPVLDSYLAPALPLDPPPEPAPELPLLPEEDPEPAPSLKLIPSVSSEAGPAPGPLPTRTLLAANSPGPTLDFTFRADPSATGLADPPIPSPVPSPILGTIPSAISLQNSTETFPSSSENFALDKRVLIRYILLKKSLEQQFPNHLLFEEDRAAQATGEFEVFVNGRLVHSKKRGDGFVNESRLQKIVSVIDEEIKKR
uniref:Selenoprotein V n=1 Tax=Pan paniscus TaxID=9597 RepID=A0A2R9CAE8_PANPA